MTLIILFAVITRMTLSYTANLYHFSSCDSPVSNAPMDVNWSVNVLWPSVSHIVRFHSALSNILLKDTLVNLQAQFIHAM